MKTLFNLDIKNYDESWTPVIRDSARLIYIKDGKVAMIESHKYHYYCFPGGGIEKSETPIEALIREAKEEAGLLVDRASIKEFGQVELKEKADEYHSIFIQQNYYYIANCSEKIVKQELDQYEQNEGFSLTFVKPKDAIYANLLVTDTTRDLNAIKRDNQILALLLEQFQELN